MEEQAKNLVNLQIALRATGFNVNMQQIIVLLATIDKVEEVGDKFTTAMVTEIGVESTLMGKNIEKFMRELSAKKES